MGCLRQTSESGNRKCILPQATGIGFAKDPGNRYSKNGDDPNC